MKMLVSHESPLELLEDSLKYNDYQYCLVHLMEEDEEYKDWFLNVRKRFGADVLLDNSIFELGESFDPGKYAYWLERINPNFYIVPDVLENARETMDKWTEWELMHQPADTNALRIGVVQGKDWNDLVECYEFMSSEADYIAISFDYSYYVVTGEGQSKLERWCTGRQRFIDQLIRENIWDWNKPHHLLGCSLAKEFSHYKNIRNIRSADTSNPVVAGIKELRYNSDLGLNDKPSIKLADLIDHEVTDDQMENIEYNVSKFKEIIKV